VADCCECGDGPSGSCATELVSYIVDFFLKIKFVAVNLTSHIALVAGKHIILQVLIAELR
jgi:hypothetical protein